MGRIILGMGNVSTMQSNFIFLFWIWPIIGRSPHFQFVNTEVHVKI